ncbi:hypothetical protein HZH68_016236 [Vespula germanica]|uniref:Uncharacterized protein n=1 Tax=Vespula germanica TaxID=30212 RepID=A0A834J7C8_VESGE|nr:hypothetical protein HZH68_016236 [Vespula germanica]
MSEIGNDKENLGAIENDSKKQDLQINLEEEEEEREDTRYEDIQGECKDYSSTLAHDLFDDRFYLDDDDSTDKFNSSQNNEKTENDIENRNDYENGRFNHELQNKLIKVEIKLRDTDDEVEEKVVPIPLKCLEGSESTVI